MDSFEGKVAVVTGGASGIGAALVRQLLSQGAKVVIADVEQAALDRMKAETEGQGGLRLVGKGVGGSAGDRGCLDESAGL